MPDNTLKKIGNNRLSKIFPKLKTQSESFIFGAKISDDSYLSVGPSVWRYVGLIYLENNQASELLKEFSWKIEKISLDEYIVKFYKGKENWLYSEVFNRSIKTDSYIGKVYLSSSNNIVYFDVQR